MKSKIFISLFLFLCVYVEALAPINTLINPTPEYTLINNVDFHPKKNLFCATFTQTDQVIFYKIDSTDNVEIVQEFKNPVSKLSGPQHAAFSPDGKKIAVANWINQTLNIYESSESNFIDEPKIIYPFPQKIFSECRPHGIIFSPCGNYLAIAFGVTDAFERAIAIFKITETKCTLVSAFTNKNGLTGIPKGIAYTPDGSCLLVTFSDLNCVKMYSLNQDHTFNQTPIQIVKRDISRPEDVKITADGKYCAITNSNKDTITFYSFEKNKITQDEPIFTLRNPEALLCTPHGIAFSFDGRYMAISQFGPIINTPCGNLNYLHLKKEDSMINLYRIDNFEYGLR